jgi:hypothetical protein
MYRYAAYDPMPIFFYIPVQFRIVLSPAALSRKHPTLCPYLSRSVSYHLLSCPVLSSCVPFPSLLSLLELLKVWKGDRWKMVDSHSISISWHSFLLFLLLSPSRSEWISVQTSKNQIQSKVKVKLLMRLIVHKICNHTISFIKCHSRIHFILICRIFTFLFRIPRK